MSARPSTSASTVSSQKSQVSQPQPKAPLAFLGMCCGVGVSTMYLSQPLLPEIGASFHVDAAKAGLVAVATQVGYAGGLLCCVPLGDIVERRGLMTKLYAVSLLATTTSGAQASAQFTAAVIAQSVTVARPVEYVSATPGATFTPSVVLLNNSARVPSAPVNWTVVSGAVTLGSGQLSAQVNSAANGSAVIAATGNLLPGAQSFIQGCAWVNVCAVATVVGVSPNNFHLQGVSGDAQVVDPGTTLGTLVLRVVDGAGNSVAGASVSIQQQVTGWQPACPATGRCAVPPVYGTSSMSAISDDDGLISVTPLQYSGTAANTRIVAASGAYGYFAVTLSKQP